MTTNEPGTSARKSKRSFVIVACASLAVASAATPQAVQADPAPTPTLLVADAGVAAADAGAVRGVLAAPASSADGGTSGGTIGEAFGYGGLGLSGTGGGRMGGIGSIGLRGPRAGVTIRPMAPTVNGRLSPDVVRRVVLRNLNQLRFCYEQLLTRDPRVAGTVTVQFVIGTDGRVVASSSGTGAGTIAQSPGCFVNAFRRWMFPAPEAGVVNVSYSFGFSFAPPTAQNTPRPRPGGMGM